jgi:hypothetical protein
LKALEKTLRDATAGHPVSGLKWTRKTIRTLAGELKRKKFRVGHSTVPRLVRKLKYTLRSNQKRLSRKQDKNRDEQMRHLLRIRKRFLKRKWPVLSIDCKKKELSGQFRNPGRTWRRQPIQVLETDFPSDAKGKAIPYGIYDVGSNEGYLVVGVSHETAEFAMNAIQRWWLEMGTGSLSGMPPTSPASGFGRRQRLWQLVVESGFTNISRSVGSHHHRKPLSGGCFQMESNRASHVLHSHSELGRATPRQL